MACPTRMTFVPASTQSDDDDTPSVPPSLPIELPHNEDYDEESKKSLFHPYAPSNQPPMKRPHSPSADQPSGSQNRSLVDDKFAPPTRYQKCDNNARVVASHYNRLQEKGRDERSKSRIFYMRNFNNWIKSMLINEYLDELKSTMKLGAPLRVLDMCCGKGGDLLKWEKGNVTHLIGTDIADVSIEQCEARYKTMLSRNGGGGWKSKKMFTAEFFACDSTMCQLRSKFHDPSIELQLVSCQFAFHYCFESLKQAECMIKNASECVRAGGYFIGTIPDAVEIMKRQRMADTDTFGNDVYTITFQCDPRNPPLFGAKYNFNLDGVVDCPEFLVHFPLLEELAKKYGLQLVMKERFVDYYQKSLGKGRFLLDRMQALEMYPPSYRNGELVAPREEYAHADEFIKKSNGRVRNVSTLSKSEWEAVSLYLVFAFKKMVKKWDAEGKVYYV